MKKIFCIVVVMVPVIFVSNLLHAAIVDVREATVPESKVTVTKFNPATMENTSMLVKSQQLSTVPVSDANQSTHELEKGSGGLFIPEDVNRSAAEGKPFVEQSPMVVASDESNKNNVSVANSTEAATVPQDKIASAQEAAVKEAKPTMLEKTIASARDGVRFITQTDYIKPVRNLYNQVVTKSTLKAIPLGVRRKTAGEIRNETTATGRTSNYNYTAYTAYDAVQGVDKLVNSSRYQADPTPKSQKERTAIVTQRQNEINQTAVSPTLTQQ